MVITRISKQRNNRRRFTIALDGTPAFDVGETILVKFGLRTNDSVDDRTVEVIRTADAENEARTAAVNYLSYRPRSSREVLQYLRRKRIPAEIAEAVVRHFESANLINNLEFARMFVRDRLQRKPIGRSLLKNQLAARGIAPATIDQVLGEAITEEDQSIAAQALAATRLRLTRRSMARLDPTKQRQRLSGYLLRHGFSNEIVQRTVRSLFRA